MNEGNEWEWSRAMFGFEDQCIQGGIFIVPINRDIDGFDGLRFEATGSYFGIPKSCNSLNMIIGSRIPDAKVDHCVSLRVK